MKNAASLALIFFVFTVNTKIMAQGKDSMPAKKVAEKGVQGDLILGKQNKKKQLNASPQLVEQKDSLHKEESTQLKKKKSKSKKS